MTPNTFKIDEDFAFCIFLVFFCIFSKFLLFHFFIFSFFSSFLVFSFIFSFSFFCSCCGCCSCCLPLFTVHHQLTNRHEAKYSAVILPESRSMLRRTKERDVFCKRDCVISQLILQKDPGNTDPQLQSALDDDGPPKCHPALPSLPHPEHQGQVPIDGWGTLGIPRDPNKDVSASSKSQATRA